MPASHRVPRALCFFASTLWTLSCARGSQEVEGSPYGVVAPIASPARSAMDAASGASCTPPIDPGPAAVPDMDASHSDQAVYIVVGDDADTIADDAGDEPAVAVPGAALPSPGELAITEVMLSPSGTEPDSEWFEIYNLASSARLLSGITIEDGYGDTHVIASSPPVVVASGAYALLVRDGAAAMQALVPASAVLYAYGTGLSWDEGIELDDGAAGDLSLWRDDTLLAEVPYGMWDASWPGQSIELATPQSDESDPGRWCVAQSPWASGSDDGTPGAASDCGP